MSATFEYNGYVGSIEISTEDNCLHGKLLFIEDLVSYEADTIQDLKAEFIAAVDDYIETCQEIGKEAQRPFKGSFNIRISAELHKRAVIEAYKEDISLNELTSKAIDSYVNRQEQPLNFEHHDHHHYHYEQNGKDVRQYTETFEDFGADLWKTINNPALKFH